MRYLIALWVFSKQVLAARCGMQQRDKLPSILRSLCYWVMLTLFRPWTWNLNEVIVCGVIWCLFLEGRTHLCAVDGESPVTSPLKEFSACRSLNKQMNKSYTLSPVSLPRHPVLDLQGNPWPRACFSSESYYKTEKLLHGRKCELWKPLEGRWRRKLVSPSLSVQQCLGTFGLQTWFFLLD